MPDYAAPKRVFGISGREDSCSTYFHLTQIRSIRERLTDQIPGRYPARYKRGGRRLPRTDPNACRVDVELLQRPCFGVAHAPEYVQCALARAIRLVVAVSGGGTGQYG